LEGSWPGGISSITFLGKNISSALSETKYLIVNLYLSCPTQVSLSVTYLCRENDFEDGNHFYRFLEHEPFIPKCFNFRGSINDSEPKPAAMIGQRITKIMSAILESYASDDRHHVDYVGISKSEEFRRYT
jgi:hypothetical protein